MGVPPLPALQHVKPLGTHYFRQQRVWWTVSCSSCFVRAVGMQILSCYRASMSAVINRVLFLACCLSCCAFQGVESSPRQMYMH